MALLAPLAILRILLIIIVLLVFAVLCAIATIGAAKHEPLSPWRRRLVRLSRHLGRVVVWLLGFWVTVKGWENYEEAAKSGVVRTCLHVRAALCPHHNPSTNDSWRRSTCLHVAQVPVPFIFLPALAVLCGAELSNLST
jgi:hypothetical protein